MYFSGLRRAIQDTEEKKFYDIALLFLKSEGYKELSIIDGAGDGGRDVSCSRTDLRIQLSVRKDWANKINSEAETTRAAGKRHLIYITNRPIRDVELTSFRKESYKQRGEVELSVYDLNRISTSLSAPGVIKSAYEALGHLVQGRITATPKEIALSNVLLFSSEAKDLRQDVIENNIKAFVYKNPSANKSDVISSILKTLPGIDIEHDANNAIARLSGRGDISIKGGIIELSHHTRNLFEAAEEEYLQSISCDIELISKSYSLSREDANRLIEIALEISAREGALNGDGIQETALSEFIANHKLSRKKDKLYEDLSKLSVARVTQYGKTLDHIFKTNTFDIYRALGRTTEIQLLLDSSVAMPLMFGLCFGSVKSRYSIGAAALHKLCESHQLQISIPREYVNEIVFHGLEAYSYLDVYGALNDQNRSHLKSSSNAFLSHYSHLRDRGELSSDYSLKEFLAHFGITSTKSSRKIENKIESILEDFNIQIFPAGRWEPDIRQEIADAKPSSPSILIDHDAAVCTFLKNSIDAGFIFATWDRAMTAVVENKSRIFASSPSRIADFLAMASPADIETTQSYNLLGSLIYCDEKKAEALAAKIERIETAEKAYEFQSIAAASRSTDTSGDESHHYAANDELYKD